MNPIVRYILKFIFIILFQVVALKNLELGFSNWWITPFVYLYIIFDLPIKFNPALTMLLAMVIGFIVDMFYDTYGMHASSCLFAALIRIYLIKMIVPKDGFDMGAVPTIQNIGMAKYLFFISVITLSYHIWFFILEAFTFKMFLLRLSQSFVSALVAIMIILIIHYIDIKPARK